MLSGSTSSCNDFRHLQQQVTSVQQQRDGLQRESQRLHATVAQALTRQQHAALQQCDQLHGENAKLRATCSSCMRRMSAPRLARTSPEELRAVIVDHSATISEQRNIDQQRSTMHSTDQSLATYRQRCGDLQQRLRYSSSMVSCRIKTVLSRARQLTRAVTERQRCSAVESVKAWRSV